MGSWQRQWRKVSRVMYWYSDNVRLQLWFSTPNVCAVFLVMTVMIFIAGQFLLRKSPSGFTRNISVFFGTFILIQLYMLALTYSRGGYLGLFVAFIAAFIICRKRLLILYLLAFVAMLIFTDENVNRVTSIGLSDGSIRNRLYLWRGGAGIIAQHPLSGITYDRLAEYYSDWYKPLWLEASYRTLVSDHLTIAALYGLPVLFLLWLASMLPISLAIRYKGAEQYRSGFVACLVGAVCGYIVASCFSTFYDQWRVSWCFITLLVILMALGVHGIIQNRRMLRLRDVLLPVVLASSVCVGILIVGVVINDRLPFDFRSIILPKSNTAVIIGKPKRESRVGIIYVYCTDSSPSHRSEIRSVIRPFLESGYAVYAFDNGVTNNPSEILNELAMTRHLSSEALYIFAHTDVACLLVATASSISSLRINGLITLNMPSSQPWKKYSPREYAQRLEIPLHLLYTKGYSISIADGEIIRAACEEHDLPVSLTSVPEFGQLSPLVMSAVINLISDDLTKRK